MNTSAKVSSKSLISAPSKAQFETLKLHLELGRVSNLPTVWSNVFAGTVLALATAGAPIHQIPFSILLIAMLAMSAFYIAGMYLNDACDAAIDQIERSTRPIPSGRISLGSVYIGTLCWFCLGWSLLFLATLNANSDASRSSWILSASALTFFIILYDKYHKNNPFSPLIMGLCRIMVVTTSYLITMAVLGVEVRTSPSLFLVAPLLLPCVVMLVYLIALTFIAKFESSSSMLRAWPIAVLMIPVGNGFAASMHSSQLLAIIPALLLTGAVLKATDWIRTKKTGGIPKAIGLLIAGISLLDAMVMAVAGSVPGFVFGIGAFFLTLLLQRKIPGT